MNDSEKETIVRPFRRIMVDVAAFSYAIGFFVSTKKFLDVEPTDPVAIGRVTADAASKLQDYVRFGYFILVVPLLTLLLVFVFPRIGKWVTRSISRPAPLSIVGLAALPLVLSPFLYLTTYKELWSVLLPPFLSWLSIYTWVRYARSEWLSRLIGAADPGAHALVITEGVSLLLFRYIWVGRRIAHVPSLLLETIFVILALVLFWSLFAVIARLASRRRDADVVATFSNAAMGATPLVLMPLVALFRLQWSTPVLTLLTALIGVGVLTYAKRSAPATLPDRIAPWLAIPTLLFVVGYASSAHSTGSIDLFHQGETLGPASDYLRDKVPYEGILPLHGLLQDGLLDAWLMTIFGRSIEVASVRAVILLALMIAATWLLAWVVFRSYLASAASVAAVLVLAADNQRAVLEIVVVMLIALGVRRSSRVPFFFAGVTTAVALFFSLEVGLYCLVAAPVSFVALSIMSARFRGVARTLASTGSFLLGFLAGAAPFFWFLASEQVLGDFFRTSFVTIPRFIDATWSLPFPDLDDWFSKNFPNESLYQLAYQVRFIVNPLVLGIAIIILLRRGIARAISLDDELLAVMTIFALITQRSALGRADVFHQWFAAFLIAPILVSLTVRAIRVTRAQPRTVRAAAMTATVGLIPITMAILWAPPLLETRLEDVIAYRSRRAGAVPGSPREMSTRRIQRIVGEIRSRSDDDDPIFDFSNQPALYFLANRRNPTRFYQVPLMSPLSFQKEIIRDLRRDPPEVVIIGSPEGFDRFDSVLNRDRARLIASWIEHHYVPSVLVEGVELWEPVESQTTRWAPPADLPGPHQIALRPSPDRRIVFPSVGTVVGADGARWSSDLTVWNPNDVPVGFRVRFVTNDSIAERRWSVEPNQGTVLADVAGSFLGTPRKLGALWILHDPTYPLVTRVLSRREPSLTRAFQADPLTTADTAEARTSRSALLITGFDHKPGERVNLSLVNFGQGPAIVDVHVVDAASRSVAGPYQVRLHEEHPFLIVSLFEQLGTSLPEAGAIRIDLKEGTAAAQASIVSSTTGSVDIVTAVPIQSR